ncbi:MAG: FG-GAP repeat protein [candidate division WOR-3 bacterium]
MGDINGDGILDVVVGAYDHHEMAGYVYGLRGDNGYPILNEIIGISPNDSMPSIKLGDIEFILRIILRVYQ